MGMRPFALLLVVAAIGCEENFVYVPATNTGAQVEGRPAANVPIPPEAPRGDVRVATFGVSSIEPREGSGEVRALHVRVIVADNTSRPWTVDTREQRVSLAERGESRAAYASADKGSAPPIVTVPAGDKRTIDLFFPLPADMAKASALPRFDAIWTVHTDARPVTERTPFERVAIEPRSAYDERWGAPYWYDPSYPSAMWIGATLPPARPVVVERPAPRR
jgi:hypothetical protein